VRRARRFNDIRRGIPRISRTVLSERLQELGHIGVVARSSGLYGPEYTLTDAGRELSDLVATLGTWGQRWLPRGADDEDLDLQPLLVDMQRRVRIDALPSHPIVVRFEIDRAKPRFLLLRASEVSLCAHNPGFPEVRVKARLTALVGWWRGDISFIQTKRIGLTVEGARDHVRAFPNWFERYQFAGVRPALAAA
jgi:HxlR-like helix-turn-helix protein